MVFYFIRRKKKSQVIINFDKHDQVIHYSKEHFKSGADKATIIDEPYDCLYTDVGDSAMIDEPGEAEYDMVNQEEITYEDISEELADIPKVFPIRINDLGKCVLEWHRNANKEFTNQFLSLYDGSDKTSKVGQSDENKLLNRFKNITAYDDNRIQLFPIGDGIIPLHTFINAGYVNGYCNARKYITTQGPIPKTVGDFWHMVWQENAQFIVMLTNLMEDKKKKCSRYWPEKENTPESFGPFVITLLEEKNMIHHMTRQIQIELPAASSTRVINHYQYITWPDHGVPDTASPLLALIRLMNDSWQYDMGPIVVHCSAGVGRTGTFIATEIAMKQIKRERIVDIVGIVTRLRQQRMKMVQTSGQYGFIHDAVLESSTEGATEVNSCEFESCFKKWSRSNPKAKESYLAIQYEILGYVTLQHDQVIRQTAEKFPDKNRSLMYLPYEKWRVPLKNVYPDYINATFVHGYSNYKGFIIAQSPMETTVKDFWKMIMDYKPSAIVMCCEEVEKHEEVCSSYWTGKVSGKYGVHIMSESLEGNVMKRKLYANNTETNESAEVLQIQINDWSANGVTRNSDTILNVILDVAEVQRKTGGKGPVIVHCSDTVGRSGVYCAANIAIEQCMTEGVVSVFQAVKAVRLHKPGAVNSQDHFETIYEVLLQYIEENTMYSNFIL